MVRLTFMQAIYLFFLSIEYGNVKWSIHTKICRAVNFITYRIYSTLTQRAMPTLNQDLNRLIAMGLIERLGKGKATLYRLR